MKIESITSFTDFATVAGVSRGTVYKWRERDDFPAKPKAGWSPATVRSYAKQRLEYAAKCQTGEHSDLKAQRLQKQIERLDVQNAIDGERLKREKLSTKREAGVLVERVKVEAEADAIGRRLAACISAFRQHETAKHPHHRELINNLCDGLRDEAREAILQHSPGNDAGQNKENRQ